MVKLKEQDELRKQAESLSRRAEELGKMAEKADEEARDALAFQRDNRHFNDAARMHRRAAEGFERIESKKEDAKREWLAAGMCWKAHAEKISEKISETRDDHKDIALCLDWAGDAYAKGGDVKTAEEMKRIAAYKYLYCVESDLKINDMLERWSNESYTLRDALKAAYASKNKEVIQEITTRAMELFADARRVINDEEKGFKETIATLVPPEIKKEKREGPMGTR